MTTPAQVPADVATRFPGLVADVPRAFERRVQGAPAAGADRLGGDSPQADAPKESPDAAKP
ncbi:MAG TPA: hypothetical protein VNO18_15605 [Xanthobacteraceae bacterium]|nr:hypothetical protein [Xanthobacteraceae bacterium]